VIDQLTMKFADIVFSALAGITAIASGVHANEKFSSLRGVVEGALDTNTPNSRNLLATIDIDTITLCLQPVLAVAIGTALSVDLDPLSLDLSVSVDLDLVKFSETCTTAATLNVRVLDFSGLGTCDIHDASFVTKEDSEDIQCSILGAGGCDWNVDMEVEAGFLGGLESLVEIEIVADACGTPIKKTVSGSVVALDALLKVALETSGSTGNIFDMNGSDAKAVVQGDVGLTMWSLKTNVPLDLGLGLDPEELGLENILKSVLSGCVLQLVDVIAAVLNERLCVLHF
jgi:hypothetical protein